MKSMENFPVIDLAPYLAVSCDLTDDPAVLSGDLDPQLKQLCCDVSRTLKETGALLVRDPRCSAEDNDRFLDMMEKYFEMPEEFKRLQERPHLHYQVMLPLHALFPTSYFQTRSCH
ncbi:hypothetical protein Dimus_036897 [Dionaea muscipula]